MKKLGIIILLLGLGLTVFSTVSFFTRDKVVTLGKVEITKKVEHRFYISPVIGIAVMGIGAIVFWQTKNSQ
jgi:ABC-type uncharacterized transport system permease subunit